MISRTTLHAIRALAYLAKQPPGQYVGAASIADEIGAPQNYLGKLLQTLSRRGLVQSQKGFGGGFCLAKEPAEISLFEVADVIDDISRWEGCFLGQAECSSEAPCAVHERWKVVRGGYLDLLRQTTIADVGSDRKVAGLFV